MTKAWYKSKTVWFNAATLAVMLGSGQYGFDLPQPVAVPLLAVGNILLRLVTSQPVGATDDL